MARSLYINGESMVYVKGPAGSAIASLTEFGLCEDQARITLHPIHSEVRLDAWGGAPMDVQRMNSFATVTLRMLQFDADVLAELVRLTTGGNLEGRVGRAGPVMGGGVARFLPGNNYVGLNIASPQMGRPWRFLSAYLKDPIGEYPLGTLRSTIPVFFQCIPYTSDPWQAGLGAQNYPLFDHTPDT